MNSTARPTSSPGRVPPVPPGPVMPPPTRLLSARPDGRTKSGSLAAIVGPAASRKQRRRRLLSTIPLRSRPATLKRLPPDAVLSRTAPRGEVRMRFPGQRLATHILQRLGGTLREQYDAVVDEDPPEGLKRLLTKLRVRSIEKPKRGTGGPKHFTAR